MTMIDEKQRKAADAQFKKEERATEGAKAMSEYKAEGEAERAKTARLRALRPAKDEYIGGGRIVRSRVLRSRGPSHTRER